VVGLLYNHLLEGAKGPIGANSSSDLNVAYGKMDPLLAHATKKHRNWNNLQQTGDERLDLIAIITHTQEPTKGFNLAYLESIPLKLFP